MGKITNFRNLHKENSSKSPAQWIYLSINSVAKLLSTNQIALHKYKPVELELFSNKACLFSWFLLLCWLTGIEARLSLTCFSELCCVQC